jgi:NADH-quinone oxidoreductase subunit L
MRRMGGLKKFMPVTYWTVLLGAISSAGIPGFAGFFSKDAIIEAARLSATPGAGFAYACVLACVFVTAAYTFRMVFMAFHGVPRFDAAHAPHESPAVVTVPLVLLAIPSIFIGWYAIETMLYGDFWRGSIVNSATMAAMKEEFHGAGAMMVHAVSTLPFWLALGGAALAYFLYIVRPDLPAVIKAKSGVLARILENKYGFDDFNDWFFAGGTRGVGKLLWKWGDQNLIDGVMVNGTAKLIGWTAGVVRRVQTGYIYHYAFTMIFGVFALLTALWFTTFK